MTWTFSLLLFVFGVVVGIGLAYSRMSLIRKKHLEWMQARNEELAQSDQEALLKYQQDYGAALAQFRQELDKMILEEHLIRAEFPTEEEEVN